MSHRSIGPKDGEQTTHTRLVSHLRTSVPHFRPIGSAVFPLSFGDPMSLWYAEKGCLDPFGPPAYHDYDGDQSVERGETTMIYESSRAHLFFATGAVSLSMPSTSLGQASGIR